MKLVAPITVILSGAVYGELFPTGKVLGSESCSTSGCHGGAGPNRGAYTIWKRYDPHTASASTLSNGMSERIVAQLHDAGRIEEQDPNKVNSCTVCHAPNRAVDPSMFKDLELREPTSVEMNTVSCANCHGGAEDWILSHTRKDYPKGALEKLGMRQLGSAYERANSCVACHQNVEDELIAAKHPPLVFELDGLLVAQGKHWREEENFSHAQTWLVGQAVALREVAAQVVRPPSKSDESLLVPERIEMQKRERLAEIEAIKLLLKSAGKTISSDGKALVKDADDYAKLISATPISAGQARDMLRLLLSQEVAFGASAFESLPEQSRVLASGYYAERLVLAIDRLNEALVVSEGKSAIDDGAFNELIKAADPPVSFDSVTCDVFKGKLAAVRKTFSLNP